MVWGDEGGGDFGMCEKKVEVVGVGVYDGKGGKGVWIEMSVKVGGVRVVWVWEGKEGVFVVVGEGECVGGDSVEIGNRKRG